MDDLDAAHQPKFPVLIVDDEPATLSLLRDTLEFAGYEAVGLTNPLEALAAIKERNFSVIISDQRMPEMAGLELLGHASRIQPQASRILITAVLDLDTSLRRSTRGRSSGLL